MGVRVRVNVRMRVRVRAWVRVRRELGDVFEPLRRPGPPIGKGTSPSVPPEGGRSEEHVSAHDPWEENMGEER